MIDNFSVCRGVFWNILEQMAILGVRSVNTNSATTLKSSPAQFVQLAPYVVYDIVLGVAYFEVRSKNLRTTMGPRPFSSQK